MSECYCGSKQEAYWIHDGHGIPLCKVCDKCKAQKLKRYRPDIFTAYEADEPIEPESKHPVSNWLNDWEKKNQ